MVDTRPIRWCGVSIMQTCNLMYNILVVIFFLPVISARLEKDLRLFSRLLPGIYSNREQFLNDANLPSLERHSSVQAIFRPVEVVFLHGTFNVYVEKYTNYAKTPFKQWLYVFETDHDALSIKMKIYDFVNENTKRKLQNNAKYIDSVKEKDVTSSKGCDITWRRLNRKSFHGTTGKDCLANVKDEQIRMEITAELTPSGLHWQESWFRVSDGAPVMATNGPYVMKKIKKIKGKRYQPRIIKQVKKLERKHLMKMRRTQNLSNRPPKRRIEPKVKSRKMINKKMLSDTAAVNARETTQILSTFSLLRDALTNGKRVHYTADVSKCSIVGQHFAQKPWFGDYIDVFDVTGGMGQDASMIRFSHSKTMKEGTDFFEILREIKVYTDGTTVIDLYHIDSVSKNVVQQSMAVCKIFDYKERKGSVRFTTNMDTNPRKLESFNSLITRLLQSRSVRVNIDISRCSGQNAELKSIGCELRDYDFLNNGSKVQVAFERKFTDPESENIINIQHHVLTFMADNTATISMSNHGIAQLKRYKVHAGQEKRFRCDIGPNSSTQSISVFVL